MTHLRVDLLVIGFGKGGKTLAAILGNQGRSVVLVEQSPAMYGGTCINVGCVPTKSMVYRSEQRRPGEDGVTAHAVAVTATQALTADLRAVNHGMFDLIPSVRVLTGKAVFTGPDSVSVGTADGAVTVSAAATVIDTGSVPVVPDIPGLRECPVAVTSAAMLSGVPRSDRLVVLGGGYIGLEFASMMAGFGTEVTVLEHHSQILRFEDDDVAASARDLLERRGVRIVTGAAIHEVSTVAGGARVSYSVDGRTTAADGDTILVALGRVPDTAGLGLDTAGIRTAANGAVAVDEFLRTSAPNVYAVGDVNGGPQFTYISLDDHRIVLDQLSGVARPRSTAQRTAVPNCLFLTPPLARVGVTEREARQAGRAVRVAVSPVAKLATVPRARIVGETAGLMKLVVDAETDLILGAALLCHDAHEIINLVSFAMRHRITATAMREGMYTHPSMSEFFNQLLGMLR
ncbi:FAD-dependent oxidoreductase [Arthrobacter sp. SLBN-53]|uniref:FAD-dependent oxidoreductase n=1 Tax=Arthrobacter sp. SLBN-53 TaxID=2768412 RepID=UPI00114E6C48|nr:FAD-dependent oxidoreductase [Arthrobacter sp. SLBN-53]TQK27491.1 pyruvate/2-oxoglutarate dehydrogenase complex dihydrolipoamide dehydrogenase (E3) component [Arthrobacter sp. SLBN-53]